MTPPQAFKAPHAFGLGVGLPRPSLPTAHCVWAKSIAGI